MTRRASHAVLWLCLAPGIVRAGEPVSSADVVAALDRGAACLAAAGRDDAAFGDPYLAYVYPEERLTGPHASDGLTYRLVDAQVILALLHRGGGLPAALDTIAARAEPRLRAAAASWRGRGFNNTIAAPRGDGIALDTFCTVGWLLGDDAMAREAVAAIAGDRWLPEGWYDGSEAFRTVADEAWCLRLVSAEAEDTPASQRVLMRIRQEVAARAEREPAGLEAFYDAWHLGMLVADGAAGVDPSPIGAVFGRWAASHADPATAGREDIVEWANLAGSPALGMLGEEGRALRDRAVRILLQRQTASGCWVIPGSSPPRLASSFLTMRALLALQRYRDAAVAGRRSANPAPKAESPAQ